MGDLEQETLNLANQAGEAKRSLTSLSPDSRRWAWFWRSIVILGVIMFFTVTLLVVNALTTTLNEHTGQINDLKHQVSNNHGVSYPVILHTCEAIPACAVTLTPAEKKVG